MEHRSRVRPEAGTNRRFKADVGLHSEPLRRAGWPIQGSVSGIKGIVSATPCLGQAPTRPGASAAAGDDHEAPHIIVKNDSDHYARTASRVPFEAIHMQKTVRNRARSSDSEAAWVWAYRRAQQRDVASGEVVPATNGSLDRKAAEEGGEALRSAGM